MPLILSIKDFAQTKRFAANGFQKSKMQKAIKFYQELLKMGFNAEYFDEKVKNSQTYKWHQMLFIQIHLSVMKGRRKPINQENGRKRGKRKLKRYL